MSERGLSARIRAELLRGGPGTCAQIAERLGADREKVARLIYQLAGRTGGVVAISHNPTVWEIYWEKGQKIAPLKPVPATGKGSGVIAGIITHGRGMRWPGGVR